jgi:Protein of unknown function (DUF2798)
MSQQKFKIPKRFTPLLFPFLLSGLMTFLITGISIARILGTHALIRAPGIFLQTWMNAYISAWLVAYPVLLLVIPIVRRLVNWLTTDE